MYTIIGFGVLKLPSPCGQLFAVVFDGTNHRVPGKSFENLVSKLKKDYEQTAEQITDAIPCFRKFVADEVMAINEAGLNPSELLAESNQFP